MTVHAACTVNLSADSIKLRWLEPYVTAGMNQKSIGLQPKGVFTGFNVVPGVAALSLDIQVDAVSGISGANVLETSGGKYCVTLIQTANIPIDVSTVFSQVVYVALDVQYAVTVTTAAQVKVVDAAELLLNPDLVLLAKVTVPGGGVIPASAINTGYRLLAGDSITPESRPTINLLPNGNFERDTEFLNPVGWTVGGGALVLATYGVPRSGNYSMQLVLGVLGTSNALSQHMVVTPGAKYRASAWIKSDGPGIAGGTVQLGIEWYSAVGGFVSQSLIEDVFSGSALTFEERKAEVTAPLTAVTARFVIYFDACQGTLYFDDAEFSVRTWEASADAGIGYAGGPNWADGTTNPATTVEAQLDKIVTDLAGASGAPKIGNAPSKILANTFSETNTFIPPAAASTAIKVQAETAQTADLLQVLDDTPTLLTSINKDGDLVFAAATRRVTWPGWYVYQDGNDIRFTNIAGAGSDYANLFRDATRTRWSLFNGTGYIEMQAEDGAGGYILTNGGLSIAPNATLEWEFSSGGALTSWNKDRITNIARATTAADAVSTEYLHETAKTRNFLLNSGFEFWQRGTTIAQGRTLAVNVWEREYACDRWYGAFVDDDGTASGQGITVTRQALGNGLTNLDYAARISWSDGGGAMAASMALVQEIDRREVLRLRGKTVKISAWLRNVDLVAGVTYTLKLVTGTGAETQLFTNTNTTGGYTTGNATPATTGAVNVNTLTTTFARVSAQSTAIAATATCAALVLQIDGLGAGGLGSSIEIAQAMLHESVSALLPPWERMEDCHSAELAACQAFYEKSYDLNTAPSTLTVTGMWQLATNVGGGALTTVPFQVRKVKAPTMTFWRTSTTIENKWEESGGTQKTITAVAGEFNFLPTPDSAGQVNGTMWGHWTADSEI